MRKQGIANSITEIYVIQRTLLVSKAIDIVVVPKNQVIKVAKLWGTLNHSGQWTC